jgi:hypothetical protein
VPVFNVSVPVLKKRSPERAAFHLFEIPR